jgi:hypothetical protein
VLTLDPDIGNYRTGDVLIEGSKISVGPAGFTMPAI